jgi:hypothetical protein
MRWRATALGMLLLSVAGCACLAVRPPTPAKTLDVRGMERPAPGERYYVLVFSSQTKPKVPRLTHTWMTVVRTTERGPGQAPAIEHHTISWMPKTLEIRAWNFNTEPGINLGLHQTIIEMAYVQRERVSMWGPYQCRPKLFVRTLVQKQFIESGKVGYQCIDSAGEAGWRGNGCDCIHAITDMDPKYGRIRYPLLNFGDWAGRAIAKRLYELDDLIEPQQVHDHLIPALGLERYPIHRRHGDILLHKLRIHGNQG